MNPESVPGGPLSHEQADAFRRDGFVVVPGFYDAAEMTDITAWVDEVQDWPETAGQHMMYFEEGDDSRDRILNPIENLPPDHEGFEGLTHGAKMLGACGQLFGEPAALSKDEINFKMPGGGGFEPYQSAPSCTDAPRRVRYYTYNKASAGDHLVRYYADKHASYPPDIEREPGKDYHYRV